MFVKMKNMDNKKVDEIYIKETVECFKPPETNLWYRCNLWDLKIFCLLINLLNIQKIESNKSGEQSNKIFKTSMISSERNIKLTRKDPKNKLPESPINTFEGNQLNFKKAKRVPIIGIK